VSPEGPACLDPSGPAPIPSCTCVQKQHLTLILTTTFINITSITTFIGIIIISIIIIIIITDSTTITPRVANFQLPPCSLTSPNATRQNNASEEEEAAAASSSAAAAQEDLPSVIYPPLFTLPERRTRPS
jgi:hypothetical protein